MTKSMAAFGQRVLTFELRVLAVAFPIESTSIYNPP